MRLLFLSAEHAAARGTGGIGSYVDTISRALASRGNDVHVLSCLADASSSDHTRGGVHIHVRPRFRVRGVSRFLQGEHARRRIELALSTFWHARKLGVFDVVEAPDWQAEGLLFALLRYPVVTHLHTPHLLLQEYNRYDVKRDSRWADRLERMAVRRSTLVSCPSQLLVDELRSRGWLGDRSVEIIRYPVDWRRFSDGASPAESDPTVVVVGRIERRKAPERVVQALDILRQQGIVGSVTFVGRSSGTRESLPYADWVRLSASLAGVACNFAGELMWHELPDVYARSRLACVPSDFESFSMAAVESMAAERPVVLSGTVGAAELLGDDPRGQTSTMGAGSLAEALRPFLVDSEWAAAVGHHNRDLVIDQCDPDTVAGLRERLYERAASRPYR